MLEAAIIYSSIIFGKILNIVAKEEIRQGRKYITAAKNILIILAAVFFIYLSLKLSVILFSFFGFIIFIFLRRAYPFYFLVGLAAFLSLLTANPILFLSIIFLLSITQSSLSSLNKKEIIIASVCFILPFSLIFLETFINANLNIFTGFVAGSLLAQLKGP